MTTLAVDKAELASVIGLPDPPAPGDGQALFNVERFALTANNVTYAVHGDDFAYWQFWPSDKPGLGIVPVWGFGTVAASAAAGIEPGQRFFGYWPMAARALLTPVAASRGGFTDGAPHRAQLPPFYNRYTGADADWGSEALQCLFRPLYATSFLIDALLSTRPVDTLLLSSASSKTALGVAQAAKGRQRVVGLTSPANHAFCESTGYYDLVLPYADVAAVPGEAIAFVDFSGNGALRLDVHTRIGGRLKESHVVGDTHWQAGNVSELPGPPAELFFAPTVAQARVAEWGGAGFDARLSTAWQRFAGTLGWLRIEHVAGRHQVADAWADLVRGRIDPAVGLVASL
jgi:hypothetical protein